jgi:hypothetical protein
MYEGSDSWAKWMVVELTLEQQLFLEAGSRELRKEKELDELKEIAVALLRQNQFQNQFIRQCVDKIAELEAVNVCNEIKEERPKSIFERISARFRTEAPSQSSSD